jgi:hypothetical protein
MKAPDNKRTLEKVEWVLIIISMCAIIMRIFHIPGGAGLFVMSMSALALYYFGTTAVVYSGSKPKTGFLIIATISGLTLCQIVLGMLFKLMFWPGGIMILLYSSFVALILLLVILNKRRKSEDTEQKSAFKSMAIRLLIFGVLAITIRYIPYDSLIRFFYRQDPVLSNLMIEEIKNPDNDSIHKALDEYREGKY